MASSGDHNSDIIEGVTDDIEMDDGIDEDNEWLRSTPKPKPKLFSFDWARGSLSIS